MAPELKTKAMYSERKTEDNDVYSVLEDRYSGSPRGNGAGDTYALGIIGLELIWSNGGVSASFGDYLMKFHLRKAMSEVVDTRTEIVTQLQRNLSDGRNITITPAVKFFLWCAGIDVRDSDPDEAISFKVSETPLRSLTKEKGISMWQKALGTDN
jgi:hypothetical protein